MKRIQLHTEGQGKRILFIFASILLAVLFLAAGFGSCKDKKDNDLPIIVITGADTKGCMNCHSETTTIGQSVRWAQAGWEQSVHKNGLLVPIIDNDGLAILGWEWEGSDAFYSNGGGCQVCHTHEGFRKKISGQYADVTAENADVITQPSPIGCFTCHSPHEKGDFMLTIPATQTVTLQSGATYDKSAGSLCAQCHQARLSGEANARERAINAAVAGYSRFGLPHFGPHHGPQSDMLMGAGGAEYTLGGQTYASSYHSTPNGPNCLNCHMTAPTSRASLSPQVSGHAFEVVGIVHGAEKGNTAGCNASGCHTSAETGTSATAAGFFHLGDVYLKKDAADTTAAQISAAMSLLANPDAACAGLLATAYTQITGGTITWTNNIYARCGTSGYSVNLPAVAGATEGTNTARFLMALWNFKFVWEDKSFGIHNKRYALQLLYDSCVDLNALTGSAVACGTRP